MPDKTPKNPFNLHADPKTAPIRDKDNVETRLEPKYQRSAPNLAPTGNLGIKRDLPNNEPAKTSKRFTIKKAGDLSKEFKSIAPKSPDKNHGWER
ncbi:MAG: hypothetical protein COB08_018695 [Rhodobacteraceae bacterium]|nr:hypothetical protein [Paracoccaceae bacterium]